MDTKGKIEFCSAQLKFLKEIDWWIQACLPAMMDFCAWRIVYTVNTSLVVLSTNYATILNNSAVKLNILLEYNSNLIDRPRKCTVTLNLTIRKTSHIW